MTRRRFLLAALPATLVAAFACTEYSSPLDPLHGQPVRRIVFTDHRGPVLVLTDEKDIRVVVDALRRLPTHSEGKVNPEFDVTFTPRRGPDLRLRLEAGSIGPAVPASSVVRRWYFQDEALYHFIQSRIRQNRASSHGPA